MNKPGLEEFQTIQQTQEISWVGLVNTSEWNLKLFLLGKFSRNEKFELYWN